MINAVIFDLDGLLIDSEIISFYIYRDLLEKYGLPFEKETYSREYSGRTALHNMQTFLEVYELPLTVEDGLVFANDREAEYFKQGVPLKAGAKELLHYLKENHYKILMASSSRRKRAEDVLRSHGILEYFDDLVFGVEIERGKPYPDIFLKACEKAKEAPEHCLVLEDSEAGILAAHRAGNPVICIPDMKMPGEEYQAMTDKILPSLKDVIDFLNQAAL